MASAHTVLSSHGHKALTDVQQAGATNNFQKPSEVEEFWQMRKETPTLAHRLAQRVRRAFSPPRRRATGHR
jgi:hypothetical protein